MSDEDRAERREMEKDSMPYKRTIKGLINTIYNHQKETSKKRSMRLPTYSESRLYDFIVSNDSFESIYSEWVKSNYITELRPSIDRLNDYIGYTLDNIQLMTWGENKAKGHNDRREGRNNKTSKAVDQFDLDGILLNTFHSIAEANRQTKATRYAIRSCCKGDRKTAGGYKWKMT